MAISKSFYRDVMAASRARSHADDKYGVYWVKKSGGRYARPDSTWRTLEQAERAAAHMTLLNPGKSVEIVTL